MVHKEELKKYLESLNQKKNDLPQKVKELSFNYEGWIVSGGARYLVGIESSVKDWDILIPWKSWQEASRTIIKGSISNSFGGFKLNFREYDIDVWPGDIGHFLIHHHSFGKKNLAINLLGNTILEAKYF